MPKQEHLPVIRWFAWTMEWKYFHSVDKTDHFCQGFNIELGLLYIPCQPGNATTISHLHYGHKILMYHFCLLTVSPPPPPHLNLYPTLLSKWFLEKQIYLHHTSIQNSSVTLHLLDHWDPYDWDRNPWNG